MGFIQNFFHNSRKNFVKGGKWEKWYFIYEAHETLFLTPDDVTPSKGVQIRDAIDMKRLMMTVIIALVPALIFGMLNVGHQHYHAIGADTAFVSMENLLYGAWHVLPIVAVSYAVGLGIEFFFATINRHMVQEGFLVTGMLIPLVMPPDIPLWQVALATAFAIVIGKEAFGGTGMNILNVALTARAFLYFAYPTDISGDVWVAKDAIALLGQDATTLVDGYSGATALAIANESSQAGQAVVANMASHFHGLTFSNLFMGFTPGSIGETSTAMALIGAVILILTGVGSWKIIVSVFGGAFIMGKVFNIGAGINKSLMLEQGNDFIPLLGGFKGLLALIVGIVLIVAAVKFLKGEIKAIVISLLITALFLIVLLMGGATNEYMLLPAEYHLVIGGLAFGAVFMATDPVSATQTEVGKWIYGFLIGVITVLIRVLNPAYPEGIMLAILLMNVFAPLIDHFVIQANKQRRLQRATV